MRNLQFTSTNNIILKWAAIFIITSVLIIYTFEFLNVDQSSKIKFLNYIPFAAYLLLAQKEDKDHSGGYSTFNQSFYLGFRFSILSCLIFSAFLYIYLTFLSPQIIEQTILAQRNKFADQGLSDDQIDKAAEITRKYGAIIKTLGTAFGLFFWGIITSIVGATIFKKVYSGFAPEEMKINS